jgi:hypothetical protein
MSIAESYGIEQDRPGYSQIEAAVSNEKIDLPKEKKAIWKCL